MTEQAKRARAAYLREWRKQNPEKFQAQLERYWERKAEKMQEEQQTNQTTGAENGKRFDT